MDIEKRSGCPINLSLEVLGDRWSLIIIRDMMFGNRRHFRDLLNHSQEGIASNILAARLKHLLAIGLISRRDDPSHSQKAIYSLTEPSIALLPVLAVMGGWGRKHLPVTPELSIRAELLEDGGPRMWEEFMNELRDIHISNPIEGANGRIASAVLTRLTAAYMQMCAQMEESRSLEDTNSVSDR